MKKPFDCNDFSTKKCEGGCNRILKKNVLARNPDAKLCYGHWVKEKGLQGRREFYNPVRQKNEVD